MEGYKHFSHTHSLNHHQVPEGNEITCSGCKSPGTGTVYVCWQCSFFLHDYCYNASRSLTHPSHPSHPLTLVPYPTYPSNSFYCNSCSLIGTGFSFSCSGCEFDIHVHCAYNIPKSFITHHPHSHVEPQQSFSLQNQTPSFNHNQSIPNNYLKPETLPNSNTQLAYNPHQAPTHHSVPSNSHLNYSIPDPSLSFTPQKAYVCHQTHSHQSIPTNPYPNPSFKQETPSFNAPAGVYTMKAPTNTQFPHTSKTENKSHEIKHFSHKHGLRLVNLKEEDYTECSICEQVISSSAYSCSKSSCSFHLHNSCFPLAQEIQHKAHASHPLTLLSTPPYENCEFTCNACREEGSGYSYHCSACQFDLHIKCASFPDTVKRDDHEHTLRLLYFCPLQGEGMTFICDVCHREVSKECWTYYCDKCDFGTHPKCVNSKVMSAEDLADELAAAQIKARIDQRARQAILDNIDGATTIYKWKYEYV